VVACFAGGEWLAGGQGQAHAPTARADGATGAAVHVAPPAPPVAPTTSFTGSGLGTGTTVAFHPALPWSLSYQVSCPGATVATASFTVASGTTDIAGFDTSVVGTATGARAGLPVGTMTVTVQLPATCSWTVDAQVEPPS